MKYFTKHIETADKPETKCAKDQPANKLYVAYINHDAVNDEGIYGNSGLDDSPRYKAATFISAEEQIPVILSQEEEMMLYSDEYY